MDKFQIPVVLFFFKREDKTLMVLNRIAQVKPRKIYLISDGPRNEEEENRVATTRTKVEEFINWDCEIVKNYASENKGVYDRIGLGAKWVLSKEESAIFLEDDNLPELTFFRYCEELLHIYRDDTRVLWICGTNYLKEYTPPDGSSYMFTKNMLPCGWASWSHKFCRFYDGELNLWDNPYIKKRVRYEYDYKPLQKQDIYCWDMEKSRLSQGFKPVSWDYQMSFSMRINSLYAIVPKYNQINNIGVDLDSLHGLTSSENIMSRRFCGLQTRPLQFPLTHPIVVLPDPKFERSIAKIITWPLNIRIKGAISSVLKVVFLVDKYDSLTATLKHRLNKLLRSKKSNF